MKKWPIGIPLLFAIHVAHTQVGPCPPGMSQYPSNNGIPSCGPLRSNNGLSGGHWETQWVALALGDDGISGWASNQSSENVAKENAIKNCEERGGAHCKVDMTYGNGCIAVVNGDHLSFSSSHLTRRKAIKAAMRQCKEANQKSCELFRAECSPAKWVGD